LDWQLVIAINVMMLSFISLLFGLLSRQYGDVSMLVLHALIVVAGGAALFTGYAHAGTLVGLLFVGLIAVPGLLLQRSTRAYLEARYAEAARFAKWAARVHPSASMRFHAQMLGALSDDDTARAIGELERMKAGAPPRQRTQIELTQARLEGRWEDVLAILGDPVNDTRGLQEFEIRALGELGRTDEMVAAYERSKAHLNALSLRNAQLFLLAYLGRPHAVALLRTGKRLPMHPDFLACWEAVAVFNAPGRRGEGRVMLEQVAAKSRLDTVRQTARRYLDRASATDHPPHSAEARAAGDELERRWQEAGEMSASRLMRLPVTMSLIAANAIMFAMEHMMGGVEDGEALLRLGALWPPFVTENGEWWRLAAALFLHYGVAHFVMNMASLSVLGRMVETVYGSRRMLAILRE
jgi:rhomboid protease GluP